MAVRALSGPNEAQFAAGGLVAEGKFSVTPYSVTPDDAEVEGLNTIPAGVSNVVVGTGVNGADDFVVLPALASVPNGFTVTLIGNTAGFEVRTPAGSAEEINSEDCDGTKEYVVGANNAIHVFRKINDTIGWMGQGFTAIGAVVTAVVPD